jgi:PhnB protein
MPTLTPYVMVESARRFMTFIEQTFHAEIGELVPLDSDPTRVIHGVAKIGDTSFFFADSGADGCQCLKTPEDPAHIQLHLQLDDPEAAHDRGVAAGAKSAMPVTDQGDGTLFGGFVDPFGTLWWLTGTK